MFDTITIYRDDIKVLSDGSSIFDSFITLWAKTVWGEKAEAEDDTDCVDYIEFTFTESKYTITLFDEKGNQVQPGQ